jgi:hypothetical protein
MKKLLFLLIATALFTVTFGNRITEINPALNAKNVLIPVGKTGKTISLMELSTISLKDFETLTDRKMKLFDRFAFKTAQKKLRKGIAEDGTIKKKKLQKFFGKAYAGETGFHAGGFFLGFLLGLIGVLIAYLIKDDFKRNRVKWAWIGCGIAVVLNIILIIAVWNSVDVY